MNKYKGICVSVLTRVEMVLARIQYLEETYGGGVVGLAAQRYVNERRRKLSQRVKAIQSQGVE